MWKRLNKSRGTRPPVNNLATMDSFIDNPYGHSIHGAANRRPNPQGEYLQAESAVRPRREEDSMPKGLPRLPFEPVQPTSSHQNQQSNFRPASSVYSQPSPNPILTQFARDQYSQATYNDNEDVSPPSSPEYEVSTYQRQQYQTADREVSPVDGMPDVSHLNLNQSHLGPLGSNIPVLRKQRNASDSSNVVTRKEASERPNGRNTVNPRWDPYSGEITTSDRGKPQSVKPKEFAGVAFRPTGLPLGNTSSITGGAKVHTSFGDRLRKLKNKNDIPAERPEWKGATGRVKLVAPVADRRDLPPLSVPRRNIVHIASPQPDTSSGPPAPETVVRSRDAETISAPPVSEPTYEEGHESPSRKHTPVDDATAAIIGPSIIAKTFVHSPSPTVRSPVEASHKTSPRSDSTGTIERNFREALRDVSASDESAEPYVQPGSHFSVTTYAPSEAQTTPRPSTDTWEKPAMPSPPRRLEPDNNSVLNRKRPQIGQPMKPSISRKAINPGAPIFISMSSSLASRRASDSSTKNLPFTPAEAQSHDVVTSLQAQLDALQNRRVNISRGIRQMTELMPKDHIILTDDVRRKRESEKIKVEALRSEEADVRREEHDIGLRLHRAYKRRDKNAVYEPTALWVRRVT